LTERVDLDALVTSYIGREADLAKLGQEIADATQNQAVVFLDLVDSTSMKLAAAPHRWLGHVYRFFEGVTQLAVETQGSVVKHIGDAVLVTFGDLRDCEAFIEKVSNPLVSSGLAKGAMDYGPVHQLRFGPGTVDDPYGTTVDRCSRLSDLATEGILLASEAYVRGLASGKAYQLLGELPLKGIPERQKVFLRVPSDPVEEAKYLKPLLQRLEYGASSSESFRSVPRSFSVDTLRYTEDSRARPFLVRYLLKLPRLPYSPIELQHVIKETKGSDPARFVGYVVEWKARYKDHDFRTGDLRVSLDGSSEGEHLWYPINLVVHGWSDEALRAFKEGDPIEFRGVLTGIGLVFEVNYVEMWRSS
jgi:class 3 adenylate cyclase